MEKQLKIYTKMKKKKFIFWNIIVLTCLTACLGKSATNEKSAKNDSIYQNEIFLLPDTLLSKEQEHMVNEIKKVLSENIVLKEGHFCNNATEEDFEARQIPLYYYDLLEKNIQELNKSIDNGDVADLEKIFKEFKNQVQ